MSACGYKFNPFVFNSKIKVVSTFGNVISYLFLGISVRETQFFFYAANRLSQGIVQNQNEEDEIKVVKLGKSSLAT